MSSTPSVPSALRFTGDGSLTVRGIPPRDLTEDDLVGLGPVNVQRAVMSGLYDVPSRKDSAAINKAAEAIDVPDPTSDEGDGAPVVDATAGKAT